MSVARGPGPAAEPGAGPVPIRVQRGTERGGAVVRPMDPRRSDDDPATPSLGSSPEDATPTPILEPQLDLPSSRQPSTTSDGSDSAGPLLQRAPLDSIAHGPGRVARPSGVVDATQAPDRQPSVQPPGAVAPGVVQRATVVPQPVRADPPVDPEPYRGRSDLPVTPMLSGLGEPSTLAEPLTSGGPLATAGPAPYQRQTWSGLPSAAPRTSATVIDLQRRTPESDAAPSSSERELDRMPASIGLPEVGEPGSGRRPAPTLRIGEPSRRPESVDFHPLQRLPIARSWPEPDTGSAVVHPHGTGPTGRAGSPVTGSPVTREDSVVQRAESDGAEPAVAPPEPIAVDAPPAGGTPAASTSAGAAAAPPQAPTSREDLDRLAASLMPALLWRIKAELVTERERRGVRSDRF